MAEIAAQVTGDNQPGGNEQPDTVKNFSFEGIHERAMDYQPESTPAAAQPAAEQVPPVKAEPQVETEVKPALEAEATNVGDATAAQLAQLKDTDLVEVTVDGQTVQMPWKDAKGGVMRQAKFTKEMTAFRKEQAEFQSKQADIDRLSNEHQVLRNLLLNKEMLRGFLQQRYPDLVAQAVAEAKQEAGVVDGGDIATVGQLQQLTKSVEERIVNVVDTLEKSLQEREVQIAQNIQDTQATLALSTQINGTIKEMFDQNKDLVNLIPEAEQVLRYKVLQLGPKTPEETLEAFKTVFGGWKEQYDAAVANANKSRVITKQKLERVNVQPQGGTGVQPQPTSFKKTNPLSGKTELDWNKIHDAALAWEK